VEKIFMMAIGATEAQIAIKVLELAVKQGWLDKFLNAFRKKHTILVLGSTGTGKTNFLQSLIELTPKAIDQMNRTEFAQKHSIKIKKQPFVFVDVPGQALHSPRRIRAIRETMSRGLSGIINVVSYGYHEYRIGKAKAVTAHGIVNEAFLKKHRQVEIDALAEWTSLLGSRDTTGWLINVITKADLWWNRKDKVLQHYVSGPYFEALGEAKSLEPIFLEYCSVFHKFYGDGTLSGNFDESDRVRARGNLLRTLLEAVGKGGLDE
jgi:energy-coupling factor transporter ATP-binding protein EcfA2